jgi:integrase
LPGEVVRLPGQPAAPALIDEFASRYGNRKTRHQYVAELTALFAATGRDHPGQLREAEILAWCSGNGRKIANNTIRNRLSRVCTFLRWCVRVGEGDPALVEALAGRDNPLRRVPRLYGKVQGKNPARWLTRDEAFGTLLAACPRNEVGMRDELLLRLGLGGMRSQEIISLKVSDLRLDHTPPHIAWIGKASRSRRIVVGTALASLFDRYLAAYAAAVRRPLRPDDPVICREKTGMGAGSLSWGNAIAQICSVQRIVKRCAEAADLGHLSPHDLRRTAAGILHRSTDEHGAHYFDLLDIQKVLDHAEPATTMRSYLDPMDTGVKERAAKVLD